MNNKSKANYESYVKAYDKKKVQLAKKGLTMYDTKLSKSEFEYKYAAVRSDLKEKVSKGERKVIGNVTQYIVSEQTYELSQAQGKKLVEVSKKFDQKLTLQQARAGMFDWTIVKKYRSEMKNMGLSNTEIQLAISQEFFGSP